MGNLNNKMLSDTTTFTKSNGIITLYFVFCIFYRFTYKILVQIHL